MNESLIIDILESIPSVTMGTVSYSDINNPSKALMNIAEEVMAEWFEAEHFNKLLDPTTETCVVFCRGINFTVNFYFLFINVVDGKTTYELIRTYDALRYPVNLLSLGTDSDAAKQLQQLITAALHEANLLNDRVLTVETENFIGFCLDTYVDALLETLDAGS